MKIKFIEVRNFRKLKSCRIDFAERETVFVGANNSGKTSAMDALRLFLKEKTFSTKDFTLSNWKPLNELASSWINNDNPTLSIEPWIAQIPQLDMWIQVEKNELHYVNHLIPTLDWRSGLLGVRLSFEPKDINILYRDFLAAFQHASTISRKEGDTQSQVSRVKLWPTSLADFLDRELKSMFETKAYLLDPAKLADVENGEARPQLLSAESMPLDGSPFTGLIKIDVINAQRGFSDANAETSTIPKVGGNLSSQLREYYTKHLDPSERPEAADLDALNSLEVAKQSFDEKLKERFIPSIAELESLNYPGLGNPAISLSSKLNVIDGLNHNSAVQFGLLKEDAGGHPVSLPEKYNGLGYQNLISMAFQLIRFRDEWMKVGKKNMQSISSRQTEGFEPLHLVLVEEPEAHLHAQVQQVFIRKAYEILRNHPLLQTHKTYSTQLIVSTHSNHIAHEIDFRSLRYFKRKNFCSGTVPTTCVVNLSKTFGTDDDTTRFAIRYLKTTHCDLFFADAVILIEGSAERILLPHFITHHFPQLSSCYISILEIGGSHAHKLKPLIQDLGIITLVITDIDSVDNTSGKSMFPEKKKNYITNNKTLQSWLPALEKIDDLLDCKSEAKQHSIYPLRVAYQVPIKIDFKDTKKTKEFEQVNPYTFEDALGLENIKLFKIMAGTGMIKKFKDAANLSSATAASKAMYEALDAGKKAEFALEILLTQDPDNLKVPSYIAEGLTWLQNTLLASRENQ